MQEKQSLINYWTSNNIIKDKRVIEAFKKIPRENFIRKENMDEVYGDYPLPIGHQQTISQPTTVMLMTGALEVKEGNKVLEVGAGSGYQAALLSVLAGKKGKVITTELIPELVKFSQENIKKCNIKNVKIIEYDGSQGYEKEAPYDRCIVTAACPNIPEPLINQLKENGIIIAPVGGLFDQTMLKGIKKQGTLKTSSLGYFRFVPLKGKYGYS